MTTVDFPALTRSAADQPVVVRAVTAIMGTVVGLTFLFGFGNVLNLALPSCRRYQAPALGGERLSTCWRWHR